MSTATEKQAQLAELCGLDTIDQMHPNVAEFCRQRLTNLDDERWDHLLNVIGRILVADRKGADQ